MGSATASRLAQVIGDLPAGLVDGFERRAGQFELAAGLEAQAGRALLAADDVLALDGWAPSRYCFGKAVEQFPDRCRPVIGQRPQRLFDEAELLVLGADAPLRLRLRRRFPGARRARACRECVAQTRRCREWVWSCARPQRAGPHQPDRYARLGAPAGPVKCWVREGILSGRTRSSSRQSPASAC